MSEAKRLAAEKAIEYVEDGMIVGVGTGSTVAFFIDALGRIKHRIAGAVSSSEQSTERLRAHGIEVMELNNTGELALYVDGADECDPHRRLIKGGGAARLAFAPVAMGMRLGGVLRPIPSHPLGLSLRREPFASRLQRRRSGCGRAGGR